MVNKHIARVLATGLSVASVLFVTTACWFYGHRPEVPTELLNK